MDHQIVEINGTKFQVDMRVATRIEELRIGDRVRVLHKVGYSKEIKVSSGIIVGFEPFKQLPTIIVAYIEEDWSSVGLKFIYFNSSLEEFQIIKSIDEDDLSINKADLLSKIDRDISKKEEELKEMNRKKKFFLDNFSKYWTPEQVLEPK